MALRTTRLSVLSLLFIYQINAQTPQTGEGCFTTTCPQPGQVRRNAVRNAQGDWIGGCNCGCPWQVYDPVSPTFCASPNVVNFDPITLIGDCSCGPRGPTQQPVPAPTTTVGVPIPMPAPATPNIPTVANFQQTVILPTLPHILPQLPTLASTPGAPGVPNNVPSPIVLGPPNDIEVICDLKGPCNCPVGHRGKCTIVCDGTTEPDACKDAIIECNNDGYPCVVHCDAPNACAGAASVMGPAGSSLEVICKGEKSCEGSAQFNGEAGTDMTVKCEGMTSCKGVQFNFGSAVSKIECNGEPDSCIGAVFNLLPNARTTPGAAYSCAGPFCPEAGVFAPEPFSNVVGLLLGGCSDVGDCGCAAGANEPCELTCDGHPDACKDGVISCNSDGFACVVNCMAEQACSGAAEIVGPKDASLTVNCIGPKACEGSTVINAALSTDVIVICEGREACKGNVELNFGYGAASVYCNGDPDSCEGVILNVQDIPGAAFSCNGPRCPVDAPQAFNNGATVPRVPQTPIVVVPAPLQPVGVVPSPIVPVPSSPQTSQTPQTPPTPQQTPQTPQQTPPAAAKHCCRTSIPNFKPWAGRCWDEITEISCLAEPNGRCAWEPLNCLPDVPHNSIKPGQCGYYDQACVDGGDCCSETCHPSGFCR